MEMTLPTSPLLPTSLNPNNYSMETSNRTILPFFVNSRIRMILPLAEDPRRPCSVDTRAFSGGGEEKKDRFLCLGDSEDRRQIIRVRVLILIL